jgi:hypothetical protein
VEPRRQMAIEKESSFTVAPLIKKILTWLVFVVGLIAATLGLAMFGACPVPPYDSHIDWAVPVQVLFLGLVPLMASLLAVRKRRTAAMVYLSGTFMAVICGLWEWFSRLYWLQNIAPWAAADSILFAVLGIFLLSMHRRIWPPLWDSSQPSWKRKIAGVLVGCLMLTLIALGSFRLGIAGASAIDCGESPPFARPRRPDQAVFTARLVLVKGWPARLLNVNRLPFAIVQEHFWGLPFWDHKIVLVGLPLQAEEPVFIDGTRMHGFLTQFLPVVEVIPCNRSRLLKDAKVDLRVLRDGPPREGVRIIGQVMHFNGNDAPSTQVAISGPAGTTEVMTDQDGIYDLSGMPPGEYAITANAKPKRIGRNRCASREDAKSGEVWGCSLQIE